MTAMRLNQHHITLGLTLIIILVIYVIVRSTASKVAGAVDENIGKPVGETLSDVTAWYHGSTGVEFTPLVIQPDYLNSDYTLTKDAEKVLWKVGDYQSVLYTLFGGRKLPMKTQYRHLIGVPLTEQVLS